MANAVSPPHSGPTTTSGRGHVEYEFACRRALPRIHSRKCIKDVVLPRCLLSRFDRFLTTTKNWLPLSYFAGTVCGVVTLFVRGASTPWLASLAVSLSLPSLVASYLTLRFDMAVLVCKTFELWWATALNGVCTVLVCWTLGDSRALAVVSSAVGHELAFFIDAIYRAPITAILASVAGAVANISYIVLSTLRLVPGSQSIVLVSLLGRQLTSNVVITNGLGSIALLLVRNAYRKFKIMQRLDDAATSKFVGSSIVYRCCLELREVQEGGPSSPTCALTIPARRPSSLSSFRQRLAQDSAAQMIQLVFNGSSKRFNAQCVMLPSRFGPASLEWPLTSKLGLQLVGLVGLAALATSHIPKKFVPNVGHHEELALTAFLGSAVYCIVLFAHAQRQLVRELGRSFDFLFIATQSLCAHLCVCDMYSWDVRCVGVAGSWLWSEWVIALDAVTPVMKRKLGYHAVVAILVGGVLLFEQFSFVMDLVFFGSLKLRERELISTSVAGHEISVRVLPLFMGRVVLTILWYARIAWRLLERKGAELLVLQGQLHYDDVELRQRVLKEASGSQLLRAMLRQTSSVRTLSSIVPLGSARTLTDATAMTST